MAEEKAKRVKKPRRDILKKKMKETKDIRVRIRLLILWQIYIIGKTVRETAELCDVSTTTVMKWKKRYVEFGYVGLADLPRSGRPSRVSKKDKRDTRKWYHAAPRSALEVCQRMCKITGVTYSMAHTRRLMHKFNMSRKVPIRFHINAAKFEEVEAWRKKTLRRIRYLKENGYTILIMDESFFLRDDNGGPRLWSRVGKRIWRPYFGNHDMFAIFGALELTPEGIRHRQCFKIYKDATKESFKEYLDCMAAQFGKIAVIMDGASPHRSKMIREHAEKNDIKLIFLPKGSRYLNAVEGCWNQTKRGMLASRFYKSRKKMLEELTEYFGAVYFELSVMKHLRRERNQELEVPDPAKT